MPTFRITSTIQKASGTQTWLADGDTEDDAMEVYCSGNAVFESEEIEVTDTDFDSIECVNPE